MRLLEGTDGRFTAPPKPAILKRLAAFAERIFLPASVDQQRTPPARRPSPAHRNIASMCGVAALLVRLPVAYNCTDPNAVGYIG